MRQKTVLIIEDNALNLKLVKQLLLLGDYSVLEAGDAETGLELIRSNPPDLILMDIQLPGINGLTATRIIKSDPVTKDIPVVAMTSHAMAGDREWAISEGCDGYISKPIDTRAFLGIIDNFTSISSQEKLLKKNLGLTIEKVKPCQNNMGKSTVCNFKPA